MVLSSPRDHPVQLSNVFASENEEKIAGYPFVCPETEAYLTSQALTFTPDGSQFIAGAYSRLGIFDVLRPGQQPIENIRTGPSKRHCGWGVKGIVSALSISLEDLLAVGLFSRRIGIYQTGQGQPMTSFQLFGHERSDDGQTDIGGTGVTQCSWSPCGRYLYVAERQSEGILVYDIRVTGRKLGLLAGRKAMTNKRMGFDVVQSNEGHEIWAGGTDGRVRVWANPHMTNDVKQPDWGWDAHGDVVASVCRDRSRKYAATCSGSSRYVGIPSRPEPPDYDGTESEDDGDSTSDCDSASSDSSSMTSTSTSSSTIIGNGVRPGDDYSLKLWNV